jgi:hypothetical protein
MGFQCGKYFIDPTGYSIDPTTGQNAQILWAGMSTEGYANPAYPVGDCYLVMPHIEPDPLPGASGPGPDHITITRKMYLQFSGTTNRGLIINDWPGHGSATITPHEYFPFCNSKGKPVYNTHTGEIINDPFS